MREIKFRAWGSHTKGKDEMHKDVQAVCGYGGECFDDYLNEDWVVMQYTGLKDKNGKEIYEGDLIKTKSDYDTGGIYQVIYNKDGNYPAFDLYNLDGSYHEMDFNMLGSLDLNDYTGEVIGNIYENKELLNEQR